MKTHFGLPAVLAALLLPAPAAADTPDEPGDGPITRPVQVAGPDDLPFDPDLPTAVERVTLQPETSVVYATAPETRWYTIPPRYETYTDRLNVEMFAVGAVVFAGTYAASFAMAVRADDTVQDRGNRQLFIPVAGPWVALGERAGCPAGATCGNETTERALLVASGLAQAGGVMLMIGALLQPTRHQVLANPRMAGRTIQITPTAGAAGPGFLLSGQF